MVRLNLQLFAKPTTDAVVNDVIRGKYGNGEARKTALAKAGYNYSEVQSAVNAKLKGNSGGTPKTNNAAKANNNKPAAANPPATSNPTFAGVDQKYVDITQQDYVAPSEETELGENWKGTVGSYENKLNAGPQFSDSVLQAFEWIQGQQEYFKNGKTSWDDEIYGQVDAIKNRDKFVYDVDNDQLFQQALASAMNSGKTAMQDTIGQASALTGGYGSTYATNAGNQAYNAFIEDAYNNLPQYYQMALDAYRAEGEEMYNLLSMYVQMGETEWNRNVDAYNTVLDYANSQRQFEYGMYQDDLTNTYNLANMYGDLYKQEHAENFAMWQNEIDNAWKIIGQQSSDYWSKTELDYKKERDEVEDSHWNATFGLQQKEYQLSTGDTNFDGVLSAEEKAAMNTTYSYDTDGNLIAGDNTGPSDFKLTDTEIKECKKLWDETGDMDKVLDYLAAKGKVPNPEDDDLLNNILGINSGSDNGNSKTDSVVSGTVTDNFRTVKGDNFDVKFGDKKYRVENKGKVKDNALVKKLNSINTGNKSVIIYDGDAYAKYADGYYKLGATNVLLWETNGYQNLLKDMQK